MSDLIDTTEMYLRTVLELEEEGIPPMRARIVERLGHSGPTVSQTVSRMERDGLLQVGPDRSLVLTELGRGRAVQVMRKHRLAERLLSDVIGLDIAHVHEEACRWEHVMSERVERRLMEVLQKPSFSPYGSPIPGLADLGGPEVVDDRPRTTLLRSADDPDHLHEVLLMPEVVQADLPLITALSEAGLLVGARFTARHLEDEVEVSLEGTDVALILDRATATSILVGKA